MFNVKAAQDAVANLHKQIESLTVDTSPITQATLYFSQQTPERVHVHATVRVLVRAIGVDSSAVVG